MIRLLEKRNTLAAPVKGQVVLLEEVPDEVFSTKMLGDGVAVIPSGNKIYAPANGTILTVFKTCHAIGMKTDFGAEVLIHIGLDTVKLEGKPFQVHVSAGSRVKQSELLVTVDFDMISSAGLETVTPIIVCNSDKYKCLSAAKEREVTVGDEILMILKNGLGKF